MARKCICFQLQFKMYKLAKYLHYTEIFVQKRQISKGQAENHNILRCKKLQI